MAKGIFEFDLNEPDDIEAHMRMVKINRYGIIIVGI
jgi:hypothetical protein